MQFSPCIDFPRNSWFAWFPLVAFFASSDIVAIPITMASFMVIVLVGIDVSPDVEELGLDLVQVSMMRNAMHTPLFYVKNTPSHN